MWFHKCAVKGIGGYHLVGYIKPQACQYKNPEGWFIDGSHPA